LLKAVGVEFVIPLLLEQAIEGDSIIVALSPDLSELTLGRG
jgi:hypothetical protein